MRDEPEYYYRYESGLYSAGVDEFDEPLGPPTIKVKLSEYLVVKRTPCGVWIQTWTGKKFINQNRTKQFAHPTKGAAKVAFIARKKKHIGFLSRSIAHAETAICLVEKLGA